MPKKAQERRNIPVTYIKYHQKKGYPTAGVGFLQKINQKKGESNTSLSEFVDKEFAKEVHDSIKYYIFGRRFNGFLPDKYDDRDIDIENLFDSQISKLAEISGIYKGVMINHGNNGPKDNIAIFSMKIHSFGYVEIQSNSYYTGQCKLVGQEKNQKTHWVIDFNYDEELDIYYSKLIVGHRDGKSLYGTLIYDGIPRTARVYFEHLYDSSVNLEDITVVKDKIENKSSLEKNIDKKPHKDSVEKIFVDYIPIFERNTVTKKANQVFDNEYIRGFLLDGFTQENTIHNKYSDVFTLNKILKLREELKLQEELKSVVGNYDLLSFTLETVSKGIRDYTSDDATIWKYPLELCSNGVAIMKVQSGNIIEGKIKYKDYKLSINFFYTDKENLFLNALFDLPDGVNYEPEKYSKLFHGTMVRMNKLGAVNISEGRACILYKANDKQNIRDDNTKCENLRLSNNKAEITEWDSKYSGSISMLSGPINRIIRAEPNPQDPYPRVDQNSYKKDFFYAACFLSNRYFTLKTAEKQDIDAIQIAIENISSRLLTAWTHRFAATHFIGKEILHSTDFGKRDDKIRLSIEQIISEQKELILAMKNKDENHPENYCMGFFCDDDLRREIRNLWGDTLFNRDPELKVWLEGEKKKVEDENSSIITPP